MRLFNLKSVYNIVLILSTAFQLFYLHIFISSFLKHWYHNV
ncbi:hypothetical protein LBUL87_0938 [Lactobacillus delbrueckii subsp. bulgaricus]|nr:hypothetical protein AT236_01068 [Lactobacillus delbrueckii subsp. bulgaricus]AQR53248.1 hypothetical protein BBD26_0020 [Lactobacillus delbrueckii subsp. bulgaricus]EHE89651.1 hypothetical protein LDBUL1519_00854 [Lactobacillus delbrueckii subsp. bulgaricus CNCM I-1519]SNR19518.1 hypothetical protein LBUL87_0938 [Lactobacillus delbrueckii subsp. bulgaricus]